MLTSRFLMKIFLLTSAAVFCIDTASASKEFTVDGIKYRDISQPSAGIHNSVEVYGSEQGGDIVIPYNVVSPLDGLTKRVDAIGFKAFAGRKDITSVTLPPYVSVRQFAFERCAGLTFMDISQVVRMETYAFMNCSNLSRVIIPSDWDWLPDGLFYGCYSLEEIDLSNIRWIGESALFSTNLSKCIMPTEPFERLDKWSLSRSGIQSVTVTTDSYVDECALKGSGLSEFTVKGTGKFKVKDYVFQNCHKLARFNMDDVTSISVGMYAFENCDALTDFDFLKVTTVGEGAFSGCTSIKRVEFSDQLVSLGGQALHGLQLDLLDMSKVTSGMAGVDGEACGSPVRHIKWPGFKGSSRDSFAKFVRATNAASKYTLETLTLGNWYGVSFAFKDFTNLRSVRWAGIMDIDDEGFAGCTALEEVDGQIGSVGRNGFSGCKSLRRVDMAYRSTKYIGDNAFIKCSLLESVGSLGYVHEGPGTTLTSVGGYAFYGTLIDSIDLSNTETIGEGAFKSTPLRTACLSRAVSIGDEAFMDCTNLVGEEMSIDGVDLVAVYLGGDCNTMGARALAGCSSLTGIVFGGSIMLSDVMQPLQLPGGSDSPFEGCPISYVRIERPLQKVSTSGARQVSDVVFPELTALAVSDSAEELPAFTGCPLLRDIRVVRNADTILKANGFHPDTYALGTLDIDGDNTPYMSAEHWKEFYNKSSRHEETSDTEADFREDRENDVRYFDMSGRELRSPSAGMYIEYRDGQAIKKTVVR